MPIASMPGRPGPTIWTVAAHAGVSQMTVSRYLRGERIMPENQEKVAQAIAELGYRYNDTASELASRQPSRIGALVFDVDDWAPQRVLAGAAEAARQSGHLLEMIRCDVDDRESVDTALQMMNRASLAGVVVLSPPDMVLERMDLSSLQTPWMIEVEPDIPSGHPMALRHPMSRAVRHLAGLGHERFFYLGGPTQWPSGRNRRTVYRDTVAELGLVDCGDTEGPWGAENGYDAMRHFPLDDHPTAIVAASDQIALGAMSWLRERGLSVPNDVSITGYDGLRDAAFYATPLTTIAIDFGAMGRRAVQALLAGEGLGSPPAMEQYPFSSELVIRASTAAPHRAR
ncbi:MAG: LacI family transcriptional regulator [Luteococcus sp.]|uniref:LacI family DNA-binding transcriptional regulator n=1 Tax=Luteococcus sp. TaxID=1969402 RepID=UPI00264A0A64|nr:LacI family DNA-binding transcriptional regulator [Luteococcus sp.]MDN5564895.1 LacI family transcriptional regulator [Luteococcus sp.]